MAERIVRSIAAPQARPDPEATAGSPHALELLRAIRSQCRLAELAAAGHEELEAVPVEATFKELGSSVDQVIDALASSNKVPFNAAEGVTIEVTCDGLFAGESLMKTIPDLPVTMAQAAEEQLSGAVLEVLRTAQERCTNGLTLAETTLIFHALTSADALRRALAGDL